MPSMDDDAAIAYYARNVPVDDSLLAPLGLVTWAAIRLHFTIRDTLGLGQYLGAGLSDSPFNLTLGRVIKELEKKAAAAGEPWAKSINEWARSYGRPAANLRDRITHAVVYTALDGVQALMTSPDPRHPRPERVTQDLLNKATGQLVLAAVRLDEIRKTCQSQKPE
jgi:hypothetical protein